MFLFPFVLLSDRKTKQQVCGRQVYYIYSLAPDVGPTLMQLRSTNPVVRLHGLNIISQLQTNYELGILFIKSHNPACCMV